VRKLAAIKMLSAGLQSDHAVLWDEKYKWWLEL